MQMYKEHRAVTMVVVVVVVVMMMMMIMTKTVSFQKKICLTIQVIRAALKKINEAMDYFRNHDALYNHCAISRWAVMQ
jgi:hypothetical protein